MRSILIIGAGKSSSYLIDYLVAQSTHHQFTLTVADKFCNVNISIIIQKSENATYIQFDIANNEQLNSLIEASSLVISMLPASLHSIIAKKCLQFGKHLITASYESKEIKQLDAEVSSKNLLFLNEVGLDPGIDHMSAMNIIDKIRANGGELILFESFCGGLIAPESDSNLWNYKFTWNPRNVVLAGQGGAAKFIQEGTYKYIPYHKLFRRTEFLTIDGYGKFEAYANRDSLKYRSIYGLDNIPTMYRGTIRRVGFSRAWNTFVQLGMTDDSYTIENSEHMSYRDFTNLFLAYSPSDSVELKLRSYLKIDQDDVMWEKLVELNLFDPTKKIGLKNATPAQILEKILTESWTMQPNDKDMIVMQHLFGYVQNGEKKQIESSMVVIGENNFYTAMAKTVGLPVGIAAVKILNNEITATGVKLPVTKEIYQPIIAELKKYNIFFTDKEVPYLGYNPENVRG